MSQPETPRETLQRLRDLLNSGASEITIDGVKTVFRSEKELNNRIRSLEVQLGIRRKRSRILRVNVGAR